MEVQQAIATRRSIRAFKDQPIPREELESIIDAARVAPSGSNRQPWDFVVVTDKDKIIELAKGAGWISQAAAVIAIVVDEFSAVWKEDAASAASTMLLKIHDLGYGSTWVQGNIEPHEDEFKSLLNVPLDKHLHIILPIGVPAESPVKEKKSLDEILHWETW